MTIQENPPVAIAQLIPEDHDIAVRPSAPSETLDSNTNDYPVKATAIPPEDSGHTPTSPFIPPQQGDTTYTITTTTAHHRVDLSHGFGRYPVLQTCPNCRQTVPTRTRDVMSGISVLAAAILFCICCPLSFIPCCVPACKTTEHYCSNCGYLVGKAEPCS